VNCPLNGTVGVGASCTYSNPGYTGTYGVSASPSPTCTTTGNSASGGSGSVIADATAATTCYVTLTPNTPPETALTSNGIIFITPTGGGGGGGGCAGVQHGKKIKVHRFVRVC
jgi:hypothetical protein